MGAPYRDRRLLSAFTGGLKPTLCRMRSERVLFMQSFLKRKVLCFGALMATITAGGALAQDQGCQFTGNSACGGDDSGQCAPHERFYSEKCSNGSIQNKCFVDDYCAKVNKGRSSLAGRAWSGGYVFQQHGDALYVTGGNAGAGSGQFVSDVLIQITWPGVLTYTGHVDTAPAPDDDFGVTIYWDRPNGNIWKR
jgi:hypothetical protein